jgi:hypothetical protein
MCVSICNQHLSSARKVAILLAISDLEFVYEGRMPFGE